MGRILVGGFALEANSFAPGVTTLDDFRAQTLVVGADVTPDALGPESELAGAWPVLVDAGHVVVPALVAASSPAPPLARDALDWIVETTLAACDDDLAGAYMVLHGSALAIDEDDPEGLLLTRLRARLGPAATIVVSVDHHANFTDRMVDAVDGVTAYRTCPHVDLRERGQQAGTLLVDALAGRTRPCCALARRPMITPADTHDSSRDPFRRLMAMCDLAEKRGALAATLLPVQPWMDVPGIGWSSVVTTDGDPELAQRLAEEIVQAAWDARHELAGGARPDAAAALKLALEGPAPVVFADTGDSTNGGSPGDSTELLRAVLDGDGRSTVLLSVRDAEAAHLAAEAGAGATVALTLGSGPRGAYNEQVAVDVLVERTATVDVSYTHPAARGQRDHAGLAALIRHGRGLWVVVHSRTVRLIDPALYHALGVDPHEVDVIQAKSHVSFRAGFASTTPRSVIADTGGPTSARLDRLPYRRRSRPLFPFEDGDV